MQELIPNGDNSPNKLSTLTYRHLLGVGLIAVELMQFEAADRIFKALLCLRPDLPHAHCLGFIAECATGSGDQAIARMNKVLVDFPDFQMGTALLGTYMKNLGMSGWQSMLEAVINDGRDEIAIALACLGLGRSQPDDTLEKDTKSPAEQMPAGAMWA
jgi:Bacterial type III secretion protein (HrpB1_HrpK)